MPSLQEGCAKIERDGYGYTGSRMFLPIDLEDPVSCTRANDEFGPGATDNASPAIMQLKPHEHIISEKEDFDRWSEIPSDVGR